MTLEIILTIVFAVLTIAGTLGSWYFYVKNKINAAIAGEIDSAENNDVDGKQKMAIVVEQLQTIIPAVLKPFFTKQLLESLVQAAFDKIEDYAKKQAGKNTTKGETSDENA